jgi:hypothetical protein
MFKKILVSFLMQFVTVENISLLLARCIAYLLKKASAKGGDSWEKSKVIIQKVERWAHLFNETYNDDNLTQAEENQIAEALENTTVVNSINEILKNNKKDEQNDNA